MAKKWKGVVKRGTKKFLEKKQIEKVISSKNSMPSLQKKYQFYCNFLSLKQSNKSIARVIDQLLLSTVDRCYANYNMICFLNLNMN